MSAAEGEAMTVQISYRVDRSSGVTVVRQQPDQPDQLVGTMQTSEDAQLIVDSLNESNRELCAQIVANQKLAKNPTREQIDESSVHSDKSLLALSREDLIQRVYDLERLHRSVRLYGVGYVLKHGTGRIQLNPLDVTVVLNADQPETEAEVRSRLAEMETVLAESDIDVSYRQRLLDEAKQQVQVLQDRIAKVRALAESAEVKGSIGCFCHGNEHNPASELCWQPVAWSIDPAELLAVLDGEGEKAQGEILAYVVRDPYTGRVSGYPPEAVRIVRRDSTEDAAYDKENKS